MTLILVTAPDCHLCGRAREVLDALGTDWREVPEFSPEGERLTAAAPPLRPLLFDHADGLIAYGRLSSRRLRRDLDRERARG